MALPADLDFLIKFDLTNDPANFELTDDTDYASLSIADEDVRGCFTAVTDPIGNVIHNNTDYSTPDIAGASSLSYIGLNCPTNTAGDIIEGLYSFTYNVVIDNPITAVDPTYIRILGDYTTQLALATEITVVRSTGNNGTYTISSLSFAGGNTFIYTVEAVPSAVADGSIQFSSQTVYSLTKTTTYDDVIPAIAITSTVDCFCGLLTSTDSTNYGDATIVSRTHTVKYPSSLSITDIVSSGAVVTVSPIYTKTWTTVIETEIEVDLGSGNTISATITGSKETLVDCDLTLCDISCCVLALNNRYLDNRTTNPVQATKDFASLTRMMQLIDMFQMFNSCSQYTEAATALAEIKQVGNCTDACSCSGDEPAIVVPLCSAGGGANINVTAGTGVTVTVALVNGNYTYQVGLSSSILAIINSVMPQNITVGTGLSVTSSVISGVKTWVLTNTAPYVEQNRMEFLCRVQYTAPTAVTITNSAYLYSGSNMNATAVVANPTIATAAANNAFLVNGFQVSSNNNYKVTLEMVTVTRGGAHGLNSLKTLDVELVNKASGSFYFRFVGTNGTPITNTTMVGTSDIYVNVKISE
jgi:hypothetical protein